MGPRLLVLNLFLTVSAGYAFASECDLPKAPTKRMALAKYIADETENHASDFVFVFLDAQGKYDPRKTVHVPLDPARSTAALPAEVLSRAKQAGTSVQVFHRSSASAYIVPIALDRMKTAFNPKIHCPEAKTKNRIVAAPPANDVGCETVDLRGVRAGTILYDQSAHSCETFGKYAKKLNTYGAIKPGSPEETDLKTAIQSFNNTFGTRIRLGDFTGNRSPGFSKITYADEKSHEIGDAVDGDQVRKEGKRNGNAD